MNPASGEPPEALFNFLRKIYNPSIEFQMYFRISEVLMHFATWLTLFIGTAVFVWTFLLVDVEDILPLYFKNGAKRTLYIPMGEGDRTHYSRTKVRVRGSRIEMQKSVGVDEWVEIGLINLNNQILTLDFLKSENPFSLNIPKNWRFSGKTLRWYSYPLKGIPTNTTNDGRALWVD